MPDRDLIAEGREALADTDRGELVRLSKSTIAELLDELEQSRTRITELEAELRDEGNRSGRMQDQLRTACAEGSAANARITELEAERDKGYRDRAEVVALLANIFPSKMADPSDETGWPVLYLETPEGQLSWHINPADLELFNTDSYALALDEDPESAPVWDGHTNEQKSVRLHRLATCYQPADFLVEQHEIDQLRGSIAAWQMNDRAQRARIAELEAERPRFSQRQFMQALRDRDEAQSRAAELADRITELEKQAKAGEQFDALLSLLAWRCTSTTTMANTIPGDDRAVWCTLPKGHAGMHHGEMPQCVPTGIEGFSKQEPMGMDWPEVSDR